MKLLRIELENLNSLYGPHQVDLAGELGGAPLFLIVGPTGSGKSSGSGTTPRREWNTSVNPSPMAAPTSSATLCVCSTHSIRGCRVTRLSFIPMSWASEPGSESRSSSTAAWPSMVDM